MLGFMDHLSSEKHSSGLSPLALLKSVAINKGDVGADIGCGSGFFTIPAAELIGMEGKVYAFDIDPRKLMELRTCIQTTNIIPILLSDPARIPLKNYFLDFVILAFVLPFIEDFKLFFQEIARLLKHGSTFVLVDSQQNPQVCWAEKSLQKTLQALGFYVVQAVVLNGSHFLIEAKIHHQ